MNQDTTGRTDPKSPKKRYAIQENLDPFYSPKDAIVVGLTCRHIYDLHTDISGTKYMRCVKCGRITTFKETRWHP